MATPLSFEGTHNEDYFQVFKYMSPFMFAYVGIGLVLGLSVLGAAWGMFLTGSALNGAAIRAPRISSKNLGECLFLVIRCLVSFCLLYHHRSFQQSQQQKTQHLLYQLFLSFSLIFFFLNKRFRPSKKKKKKNFVFFFLYFFFVSNSDFLFFFFFFFYFFFFKKTF